MGASGSEYRVPFKGSVEESLIAIQEQVLSDGEYSDWPWETFDPDYLDGTPFVSRPTSLQALTAAKQFEVFWTAGTHSILNVERVWTEGQEEDVGTIRPLTREELLQVFGLQRPTAADFDRVHGLKPRSPLEDLPCRICGRSVVIYNGETPAEVFFWGWSGD